VKIYEISVVFGKRVKWMDFVWWWYVTNGDSIYYKSYHC